MDKSVLVQKQVKDNAEDLQNEFLDMKNWEEQMKRKDEELRREACGESTLPPIRSKTKNKNKTKTAPTKENGNSNIKSKRIKSYDYSAWEKFDVDKACKDVDKKEQSDDSGDETMSKEELQKAHEIATNHKNEGNLFVLSSEWVKAIQCYNQAITVFPYDAVFFANRALCQLKLNNFHSAESDCSAAIQLDETYVKAYHRRATARMNLKQYKEAKQDVEKILKLEPFSKEAKSLLAQIENKIIVSDSPTMPKRSTEKSPVKPIVDKKIEEKYCSNVTSSIKTVDGKDNADIKHIKEDKRDIKNNSELKQINSIKNNIKPEENLINVKDDKTAHVEPVALNKKKNNSRIPDWLPEKDDVAIIETVTRPPHLRSKKSFKRIPIEEAEFNSTQQNYKNNKVIYQRNASEQLKTNNIDDNIQANNSIKVFESLESNKIPPVPKTAVQFIMNWKTNKSLEFRYKYLQQLPENSLLNIFQDSMESDIFSEIIDVLRIEFIKRKDFIFSYLKDLSDVKRFRALIMFMSNKEKESLKILFEYCKTVENVPLDEIMLLQNRYEI